MQLRQCSNAKHQVIVHAEAFGEGQEIDLLKPMLQGVRDNFKRIGQKQDVFTRTKLTADSGYHSEKNVKMLFDENIEAYVAQQMIERFDSARGRHEYSRRMGTVEPIFAHIRHAISLHRFTLRGNLKVNIQWKL